LEPSTNTNEIEGSGNISVAGDNNIVTIKIYLFSSESIESLKELIENLELIVYKKEYEKGKEG
jgi:hypothetical protein